MSEGRRYEKQTIPDLTHFGCQKKDQILSDLNSEARFGIFSFFPYFRRPFNMFFFLISIFYLPCIFKNLKLNSRPLRVLEIDFLVNPLNSACLKPWKPLYLPCISKLAVFLTTLLNMRTCASPFRISRKRLDGLR